MTMWETLAMLERREVITMNPDNKQCCELDRDEDGFCQHRGYHPIYVEPLCQEFWFDPRYKQKICSTHDYMWTDDSPVCNAILSSD